MNRIYKLWIVIHIYRHTSDFGLSASSEIITHHLLYTPPSHRGRFKPVYKRDPINQFINPSMVRCRRRRATIPIYVIHVDGVHTITRTKHMIRVPRSLCNYMVA